MEYKRHQRNAWGWRGAWGTAGRHSARLHIPLFRLCPHSAQPSATPVLRRHPAGVLLPPRIHACSTEHPAPPEHHALPFCSHQDLQAPHPQLFRGSPTPRPPLPHAKPGTPCRGRAPLSGAAQEPRGIAPPPHTMSPLCCGIPSRLLPRRHALTSMPSAPGTPGGPGGPRGPGSPGGPRYGERRRGWGSGGSSQTPGDAQGSGYIARNVALEHWDRAGTPREPP